MSWLQARVSAFVLYALDFVGTAAFAALGGWAADRRHMDLFGILVLGLVTAVGGGTLRLLAVHYKWSLPRS